MNSKQNIQKRETKRQKTSFFKAQVENAGLCESIFNKI